MTLMAVVCSSWSIVNAGAERDLLCPWGDETLLGVRQGNKMVSRTGCSGLLKHVLLHVSLALREDIIFGGLSVMFRPNMDARESFVITPSTPSTLGLGAG